MEYKGKLYGKVGDNYFQLLETSDDVDSMRSVIDKLLHEDNPVYNELELMIIKNSKAKITETNDATPVKVDL